MQQRLFQQHRPEAALLDAFVQGPPRGHIGLSAWTFSTSMKKALATIQLRGQFRRVESSSGACWNRCLALCRLSDVQFVEGLDMALRVVGAGLGRTGTTSLKTALELLLKAPCYHMDEVYSHPEHVEVWRAAIRGDAADLGGIMEGYAATVDFPAGAFWRELNALFPDALVILTVRESAEAWWRSANRTIFEKNRQPVSSGDPLAVSSGMIAELMSSRFTPDWNDRDSAMAAYARHNDAVRQGVPPGRLLEWKPDDGWEPICIALNLPVPSTAFPHKNSAREFRGAFGLE